MKNRIFISLFLFINVCVFAQKIDTDSLLIATHKQINIEKNYPKAIQLSHLGIKNAPNYLDFHLALGRTFMITKQIDSARYYLNYVIEKNPKYKEAFSYLTKLEIAEKNSDNAIKISDKALTFYPDEKEFNLLKLDAISLQNDDDKTIVELNLLVQKYPNDNAIKQQLVELRTKSNADRVGINYSNTTFSRSGIGPWHYVGLQYARERKKLSVIGHINFVDRHSFQTSNSGLQYEVETYFKIDKKNYSYADIALSNDDIVFPKLRLGYSYFRSFGKSWEADAGIRYTKTTNSEFYASAFGIGKYVGAYWINLKSYMLFFENKTYPAFTATSRYYFNTKYDYLTASIGYGTSPDERIILNQFQQRLSFNSYRFGTGYYKLFNKHYCLGLQVNYNNQEYQKNKYQNEYNLFVSFQYKF